jgi:hypothetical protein
MKPTLVRRLSVFTGWLIVFGCGVPLGSSGQAAPRFVPPGLGLDHPAVAAVARVQDQVTPGLMTLPGVVGTATGIDADGQLAIKVYIEHPGVQGIPRSVNGLPVDLEITGPIRALVVDTTQRFDRPVPIGVSVGHPAITAGTLGCRVKAVAGDGVLFFILSNNHVLANANNASLGDPILQPGPYDGGTLNDQVASLYDFEPIVFGGGANLMDAAIALVTLQGTTYNVGYATPDGADAYGAPSSITANAVLGMPVLKYGRTTSLTSGSVSALNVTVEVCYEAAYRGPFLRCVKSAVFQGQITIGPGGFSTGGDSGSLILTADGNKNPVALLFAGSSTHTIANPIDPVLTRFGVSIDDGLLTADRGTLAGTVSDGGTGIAIAGARVTVSTTGQFATTDNNGSYTLENVPAGPHEVTASALGYSNTTASVSIIADTINPQDFSLAPLPAGTVTGQVTAAATSAGIPNVRVKVHATDQTATTDANGNYTLKNVPAGPQTLSALVNGYAGETQTMTVDEDATTPLDFALNAAMVAPQAFATTEAASHSSTLSQAIRMQEVYANSHFGSTPIYITSLAFRLTNPSGAGTTVPGQSGTVASSVHTNTVPGFTALPRTFPEPVATPQAVESLNVTIQLSTTAVNPDSMSTSFASNTGNDALTVFSGELDVHAIGDAAPGSPNLFEIIVPVADDGFYYNPAAGNLLVDIRTYTPVSMNVDASSASADGASRAFALDPNATSAAHRDTGADVIQFGVVPAPAPPPSEIGLSAHGYKVKGRQTVDLGWTGAAGSVTVYRNDVPIATTSNSSYTDNIGAVGGGSYTYQVKETAPEGRVSNTVTVTF